MEIVRDEKMAQRNRWDALKSVLAAQHNGPPLVRRRSPDVTVTASFAQRRLWFLDALEPGTATHTLAVAHRVTGLLDVPALERAFTEVVRRHEVLRTTLARADEGEIVQIIHPPRAAVLERIDLSALAPQDREKAVQERADTEAAHAFDLETGPLLRVVLLRISGEDHRLLMAVHHAIFDGWSFDVLMAEIGALYDAFTAGSSSPLPEPVLQYADVALWQRQRFQDSARDRLLAYWSERMSAAPPVLTMPADRPRHPGRTRRGASRVLNLPPDAARGMKSLAERSGVTLFTVLLAGFHIFLHRHTGEPDIVIGVPVAGRPRAELADMIGLLVNTLPLRLRLEGTLTVQDVIARVADAVNGGLAHQDLPFECLVEAVNPPRHSDHPPLVQVMFAFQNVRRTGWRLRGVDIESSALDPCRVTFDLTLYMQEGPRGLTATLHYDSSLFDEGTAEAFLARFAVLLEGMAANPQACVAMLALLPADERARLSSWNATAAPYPDPCSIPALFAAQVGSAPAATAIDGDDSSATSYRELDRQANQLARRLRALGVGAEARVGVWIRRSSAQIVALLAVLKAGGAYMPLDPGMSAAQVEARLHDAGAAVLVTDTPAAHTDISTLYLGEARPDIAAENDGPLEGNIAPDQLACVLFTSGSTGDAKAVAVTHRGIVRMVLGMGAATPAPSDALLHLAPLSFDAATFEIWGALLNGARLALAPEGPPTPDMVAALIRRHGVSLMWLTAGLFEMIVDMRVEALAPLRTLIVGGDVVSPAHAARFLSHAPTCRLFNGYGPTEATTFTCLHPITAEALADGEPIPIGRPLANTRMYVLDDARQPVPVGVVGEAWIGGDGIARGYLNDASLTRERFIPDPFDPRPEARLYRTGDRVRQRGDGVFAFLGRADGQVKIRGLRIELGAVEAALLRCPGVAQAAALVVGDGAAGKRLAAWIVPQPGVDPRPGLRQHLRAWLPDAMIPAGVGLLDRLPLTTNGKLDRRALPPPEGGLENNAVAPGDVIEGTLLSLFEEALGVHPIGLNDSFFDRGGDSLLVVRLTLLIEEALGVTPPLLAIFETPTVAGLAERLRAMPRGAAAPDDAGLVTVRRGDGTQPVFLVPGGHGGMVEMALYARLLRRLESNPAVYGLRARGMDGSRPLPPDVTALAAAHLETLRKIQPTGPYRLVGECVGAVVAFEMARQLTDAGETVSALILMDGWCPSAAGQFHYEWVLRPRAIRRARLASLRLARAELSAVFQDHRRAFMRQGWRQRRHQIFDAIDSLWRVTRRWIPAFSGTAWPQPGQTAAAERAYVRTLMSHRPSRYRGPVTLIVSEESLSQGIDVGWRRRTDGELVVHCVPGDHDSYLRTHVDATLACVNACLERGALRKQS